MINSYLKRLGFNEKEINIYLVIIEYKKILPSVISSITKINRTTVYSVIKKLKDRLLITEDLQSKGKYILALPLENLHNLIEQEKVELIKKENNIEKVISKLKNLDKKNIYIPKIQFIEEDYLEKFLYSELEKWNNSILKYDEKCWYGFQDHILVEKYEKFIEFFWKQTPKKINLQLFSNSSEIENKIKGISKRREIYFWNKDNEFDSTMWICGDYIITIFLKEKPFYLIETYNPILAKNLRNIFSVMWKDKKY